MSSLRKACLVLEDEALVALDLRDELKSRGIDVIGPFDTCAEALLSLSYDRPDVAILDAIVLDGPCTAVAARLTELNVPIVVLSGSSERMAIVDEVRPSAWLLKPMPSDIVVDAAIEAAESRL